MTTETDQQFLAWIHGRLERVHNEPALSDYMHRLRAIILSLPPGQITGGLACNSSKELEQMIDEQRKRQPEKGSMTTEQPMTPPPELVKQWRDQWLDAAAEDDSQNLGLKSSLMDHIAAQAARWGADQELEVCCEWLISHGWFGSSNHDAIRGLRAARRPNPPSLKEQALAVLDDASDRLDAARYGFLRCALELLP